MDSDCDRFDEIVRKLKTDEDVTEQEINFYIAHEKTCEEPGHKAPTWKTLEKDPLTKPIADRIKARLLCAIKSAE